MILLITLSAFLFASLILIKKIYIFKYIDVEFYILVAHITSFFLILIYSLCNYSTFYSEKNILGFKKIAPYFVLIKAITLMNGFIFLYLLKSSNYSKFMSLNPIITIMISVLLGYIVMNEKLKKINIIGIIMALISIYLIKM